MRRLFLEGKIIKADNIGKNNSQKVNITDILGIFSFHKRIQRRKTMVLKKGKFCKQEMFDFESN